MVGWQGVYLRVVGVCDSKSLIVVSDVFSMELDDKIVLEVCQAKLNGSSLKTLCSSGNSIIYPCCNDKDGLLFFIFLMLVCLFFAKGEYQVLTNSDSTRKVIDIAALLGKSMGMWHVSALVLLFSCFSYASLYKLDYVGIYVHAFSLNIFITGLALIDCSASSETIGVLKRVVDLGCCIVLANKKPLTSTMVIKSSRWIETITFEYYYAFDVEYFSV